MSARAWLAGLVLLAVAIVVSQPMDSTATSIPSSNLEHTGNYLAKAIWNNDVTSNDTTIYFPAESIQQAIGESRFVTTEDSAATINFIAYDFFLSTSPCTITVFNLDSDSVVVPLDENEATSGLIPFKNTRKIRVYLQGANSLALWGFR